MHSQARRLAFLFVAVAALPVLAVLAAFFTYDPLQVFHRPWGRGPTLHGNMRLQAAGIIRREPFDSVVLGTSMMENTSADEASRLLGGRFVNVSLTASDFVERAIVLGYLLNRRRVDQVVYSLDSVYTNSRKGYPLFPMPTWDFLYDRNPFNDFRVYLNSHFLGCLSRWSREEACVGRSVSLDRPNAWFGEAEHAVRFGGLDKWCQARDNYQIKDAREAIRKAIARIAAADNTVPKEDELREKTARALGYVDEHVVRLVRAHPETRFRLVFPPYSRAIFAFWHQSMPLNSAIHLAVLRHLANLASQLPNLEIHGFEDADFLDDLGNYKDLAHYRETFDSRILAAMAAGDHRLNAGNVDGYIANGAARARAFNLTTLHNRLEHCLDARLDTH